MYTSPQLARFEAALVQSSTRGVLFGRKENVLILWLARCEACIYTSPQLASFEAVFTPSSTRGVLFGRKENALILWLARCEACMYTSPQLASFEAGFALCPTPQQIVVGIGQLYRARPHSNMQEAGSLSART
jgi:hypothetical protein